MTKLNTLELFSGSGTISKSFADAGHNTFEIDNRRRKGVCEPDLKADIGSLSALEIVNHYENKLQECINEIDIVWASFPCTTFSYGAGLFHQSKQHVSPEYMQSIKLLKHTLYLIDELRPIYFFIENPRGHLRYEKVLQDWLVNKGMTKLFTWGSYGFPTTKPTNIFTNAFSFEPRELIPYGRGAKFNKHDMQDMTVCQKQKIPAFFAKDLVEWCEKNCIDSNK